MKHDEFYIGYLQAMPPAIKRRVTTAVSAIAVVATAIVGGFVLMQRPLAVSRFEFGHARQIEGYLVHAPAPALLVHDGRHWSHHWLVSPGKFGAERTLADAGDGWVRLRATLIEREPWRMLEVVPDTVRVLDGSRMPPPVSPRPATGGPVTLQGEIVDSKCFLGVMNPGERVIHRDCAVRCLSGGVPAMFTYQAEDGTARLALLLTGDGQPAGRVLLERAGKRTTLSGVLSTVGDYDVLRLAVPDVP
jgi:hypothetical protein